MRYNDSYDKHVNIGCENKKCSENIHIYAIKAILWIFDAFHSLNYLTAIKKLQIYCN